MEDRGCRALSRSNCSKNNALIYNRWKTLPKFGQAAHRVTMPSRMKRKYENVKNITKRMALPLHGQFGQFWAVLGSCVFPTGKHIIYKLFTFAGKVSCLVRCLGSRHFSSWAATWAANLFGQLGRELGSWAAEGFGQAVGHGFGHLGRQFGILGSYLGSWAGILIVG